MLFNLSLKGKHLFFWLPLFVCCADNLPRECFVPALHVCCCCLPLHAVLDIPLGHDPPVLAPVPPQAVSCCLPSLAPCAGFHVFDGVVGCITACCSLA